MQGLFPGMGGNTDHRQLCEFRAGRLTYDEETKMVTADPRKGEVELFKDADGLVHLTWKDRTTGVVDEDCDIIILPGEATFQVVEKCTTGRVFLIDFGENGQKLFFYLQEPSPDGDAKYFDLIRAQLTGE